MQDKLPMQDKPSERSASFDKTEPLIPVECRLLETTMCVPAEWLRPTSKFNERWLRGEKRRLYIQEHIRELDGLTEEQREDLATLMRLPFDYVWEFIGSRRSRQYQELTLKELLDLIERECRAAGYLPLS